MTLESIVLLGGAGGLVVVFTVVVLAKMGLLETSVSWFLVV